jgi:hypothetical protein
MTQSRLAGPLRVPDEKAFCELYCQQAAELNGSLLCRWRVDEHADQAHTGSAWQANQRSAIATTHAAHVQLKAQ